jgi:hypothetical protein
MVWIRSRNRNFSKVGTVTDSYASTTLFTYEEEKTFFKIQNALAKQRNQNLHMF